MTDARLDGQRLAACALWIAGSILSSCGQPPVRGSDDGGTNDSSSSLPNPTGSVTVTSMVGCGAGALPGATCRAINVTCPGVPDLSAIVAATLPSDTPHGTIVVHDGRGGTTFFGEALAGDYVASGFRVVQLEWATDWEQTPGGVPGMLAAACRPATVYRWLFGDTHLSSRSNGYCLFGFSGGSGAAAYALAHYGLGEEVDYAQLAAGPPFGRIDYGCDPASAPAAVEPLACSAVPSAPFAYFGPYLTYVQMLEGTATCGQPNPSSEDVKRWQRDSVVSERGAYDYPHTGLSFWACGSTPQIANGLGGFYFDQVTSAKSMHCYASACMGEQAFSDPSGEADMRADMIAGCVPHHL